MQDRFICPLTGKEISDIQCFDISMVIEGMAPEFTIDEEVAPDNIKACETQCMACKMHPQ